jgi:DeoR/GlpR family transcriptional regulator of sugar metabolism
MIDLKFPLTNIQVELLKLYSTNLNDADIAELKNVLARFYADKAINKANAIWDEKGLTDANMEDWLNEKS